MLLLDGVAKPSISPSDNKSCTVANSLLFKLSSALIGSLGFLGPLAPLIIFVIFYSATIWLVSIPADITTDPVTISP